MSVDKERQREEITANNKRILEQKTMAFIQELRNIREESIKGKLNKHETFFLMKAKLDEYEMDNFYDECPEYEAGTDSQPVLSSLYKFIKWHYWNILYSLFGDELENLDPGFNRGEVPILLPGIKFMFQCLQSPAAVPDAQETEQIVSAMNDNATKIETSAIVFDGKLPDSVYAITGYYPQFGEHYPILAEKKILEPKGLFLHWNKSDVSIQEYFNFIKPSISKNSWRIIKNNFDNAKEAWGHQGRYSKDCKPSADFLEIKKIIDTKY